MIVRFTRPVRESDPPIFDVSTPNVVLDGYMLYIRDGQKLSEYRSLEGGWSVVAPHHPVVYRKVEIVP